jgi:hypothetical protein
LDGFAWDETICSSGYLLSGSSFCPGRLFGYSRLEFNFFSWGGAGAMFDVYLNDRGDLLVVRKGLTLSLLGDGSARWRKKKRVVSVSDEICRAVQNQGYYIRKRKDAIGRVPAS